MFSPALAGGNSYFSRTQFSFFKYFPILLWVQTLRVQAGLFIPLREWRYWGINCTYLQLSVLLVGLPEPRTELNHPVFTFQIHLQAKSPQPNSLTHSKGLRMKKRTAHLKGKVTLSCRQCIYHVWGCVMWGTCGCFAHIFPCFVFPWL